MHGLLIGLGHSRIGLSRAGGVESSNRVDGYRASLEKAGVSIDEG